jgi:hypothetical protein
MRNALASPNQTLTGRARHSVFSICGLRNGLDIPHYRQLTFSGRDRLAPAFWALGRVDP